MVASNWTKIIFENSETKDINLTPRLNISFPYELNNGDNGYVKFGGKIRYKEKERDIKTQEFGAYFENSTIYPRRWSGAWDSP